VGEGSGPGRPFEPPSPALVPLARFHVELGPPFELGPGPGGRRRIIPSVGGHFDGPRLRGTVEPMGADWQLVWTDGTAVIDTRYTLRTDDGVLLYLATRGFRTGPEEVLVRLAAGEEVDPNDYTFRVVCSLETPDGPYSWLRSRIVLASAMRLPGAVVYDAYEVC